MLPATIVATHPGGRRDVYRPADPVFKWFTLANGDKAVAKVLRLVNVEEQDFVNLYRILEVILQEVGIDEVCRRGWATRTAIRQFRKAANNPSVSGDAARHGVARDASDKKRQARAVLQDDAEAFVMGIVHAWLAQK
jgi:hypothetical protein